MPFSMGMKTIGLQGLIATFRNPGGRIMDRMHDDLDMAGELLLGEIPKHIIGSRATNPPEVLGVVTGRLRQSMGKKLIRRGTGWELQVGPQRVKYGAIHELGGFAGRGRSTRIPARPYEGPSLAAQREPIVNLLGDGLVATIRGS